MEAETIVVGADPEIFVERKDTSLFNAFEFLPNKHEPLKTEAGQNVYWDGFQAEFTVAPSNNVNDVVESVRLGLKAAIKAARKKERGVRLSAQTVVDVSLEEIAGLSEEYVMFGCMPSFNAYDITGLGLDGSKVNVRFAGGHIHFGTGPQTDEWTLNTVKTLDAILGVACVSLFENFDNPVRRQYYGLCGEYRLPPHGLEYRALSDAWVFHPKTAAAILEFARRTVAYANSGKNKWEATEKEVIETILRCDVGKAREILTRNKACLKAIGFDNTIDLFKPIEESIAGFGNDIAKAWGI